MLGKTPTSWDPKHYFLIFLTIYKKAPQEGVEWVSLEARDSRCTWDPLVVYDSGSALVKSSSIFHILLP